VFDNEKMIMTTSSFNFRVGMVTHALVDFAQGFQAQTDDR
jgi:hypothetical protein